MKPFQILNEDDTHGTRPEKDPCGYESAVFGAMKEIYKGLDLHIEVAEFSYLSFDLRRGVW